jgi:Na+-driven multidrug efflux pump
MGKPELVFVMLICRDLTDLLFQGGQNRIGELCIRTTRYCALLLCLLGLPLVLGSYPLLSLWVGKKYAAQSALYLEVLFLGNIVRQLAFPYILWVVATGRQHLATIAAISEACVNVMVSVCFVYCSHRLVGRLEAGRAARGSGDGAPAVIVVGVPI